MPQKVMRPHQLILIVAFTIGVLGYTFFASTDDGFWYKANAMMIFGLCGSYYMYVRTRERLTKAMVQVFAWCAFTNMLDELVLDPYKTQPGEYMLAAFGIGTAILNYHNRTWTALFMIPFKKYENVWGKRRK